MTENTIPESVNLPPEISEPDAAYTPPAFEDLSLAEVFGRLLSRPAQTVRNFNAAMSQAAEKRVRATPLPSADRLAEEVYRRSASPKAATPNFASLIDMKTAGILGIMLSGWLIAVVGGIYMIHNLRARSTGDLIAGTLLMIIGAVAFAFAASRSISFPRLPALEKPVTDPLRSLDEFVNRYALRIMLIGVSLLMSGGAWVFNSQNNFTVLGVLCWLFSVIGWSLALAPEIIAADAVQQFARSVITVPNRIISFRVSWTLIALVVILIIGAYFRLTNIDAYPPDMTSDHVEKALDAGLISEGLRPIFLPNNGGREVAHFYILALMHDILNVPIDFNLLKLATGLEGIIGLLVAFWLGREFIGDENRDLGNLTGLIMAALLAVSYWHIMLSRLGLRIILTPLVISVVLIYFVRALRFNRRVDYVKAGLALGIGVYCYQAIRMAPVFLVIGFVIALILRGREWGAFRRYVLNFAVLVLIAVAVFVPLGRYMIENPGSFWSRTTGRIFGDDTVEIKDPQTGGVVSRVANTQDRIEALKQNMAFFNGNMQTALFMFNWRGDASWITGSPSAMPQLDTITGALFILGLGLWIVRMIRRRDPGDWLIPFGLVVMLFPTALSLAYTIEVPSGTRASGTMPFVYLMAAFAAALILRQAWRTLNGTLPRAGLAIAAVLVLLLTASANYNTYFVEAMTQYRASTLPHHQAGGILKGFVASTGAPGNAFMIAYDYWWDHRALAIESGDPHWPNGVYRDNYIQRLILMIKEAAGTTYAFRPDRQVMFFVNQNDAQVLAGLQAWLPGATIEKITSFNAAHDFVLVIAPPVGCGWFEQNIGATSPVCAVGAGQ